MYRSTSARATNGRASLCSVKRMEVGTEHKGEVWTDVLGWHQDEVTIGDDGWADFRCPARSVSIWVKKDAKMREEFNK